MQKARSSNDFAIFSVKRNDCRMHFCYICKGKTINFWCNAKLKEKFALFLKHEKFIVLSIFKRLIIIILIKEIEIDC